MTHKIMPGKRWLLAVLLTVGFPWLASAHQPHLVSQAVTTVKQPEISQAFYARLSGDTQTYQWQAAAPFELYVGLLVPDITGVRTDMTASIFQDGRLIATLDGRQFSWSPYFEKYGGDYYLWGPEFAAPGSSRTAIKGAAGSSGALRDHYF